MTTATEVKHTPGPWELQLLPPTGTSMTYIGIRQAETRKSVGYAQSSESADIAEANARLIAAAPELLEALRAAESALRWAVQESAGKVRREIVGGWLHHADECRSVIAKAEGR